MKRILLVDDDANLADSAKDILDDAGHWVAIASTLKEARATLAVHPIDILVVDFNLPDGKGPTLAQEAKRLYPGLKLILMTGEAPGAGISSSALFDSVLTKPVDPAAFLSLLAGYDNVS